MSTEIEAKFLVTGHDTADRIRALAQVGSYSLLEGRVEIVQDIYLDTADRALLSAGYACRRREREGQTVITVKSVTGRIGPVHRREELEVSVSGDSPPQAWPESEARGKVLELAGDKPLEEMFRLGQTRLVRRVIDSERHVADCSLDDVRVGAGRTARRWTELEVELVPTGTEEDLAALSGWLQTTLGLHASTGSKFERALDALGTRRAAGPRLRQERSIVLEAPDDPAGGLPLSALAAMGYTATAHRHGTDQRIYFDTHDGAFLSKGHTVVYSRPEGTWRLFEGEDTRAEQKGLPSAPPPEADWAMALRAVSPRAPSIPCLEAALVETEYRISGIVAHQLRIRSQQWTFLAPGEDPVPHTLLRLVVTGPPTESAYFTSVLQARLGFHLPRRSLLETGLALMGIPAPGAPLPAEFLVSPGDSVGRACRRIFQGEAWKMRANLRGALHDLDPEFVHDLRVATRRARSALRLFSRIVDPGEGSVLVDDLRWIARLLGATRDLDVFIERLEQQFEAAEADADFREIVRGGLHAQRAGALAGLVEALRSERFAGLLSKLESTPAAEDTPPAPRFACARIDKAFARLAAWIDRPPEGLTDPELHRIRILFKRLRYTCEFFRPLMADGASGLIELFVGFQDCLGLHQDAATALRMLSGLLTEMPPDGRSNGFFLSMGAMLQVQRDIQKDQRERFARRWKSAPELVEAWHRLRGGLREAG
ncbi:MAG: CHAD domain-containing protein [Spirochaetia bacterium]